MNVNFIDEICLASPKNNTEDLAKEFIQRYLQYHKAGLFFYGDASGQNRSTLAKEHNFEQFARVCRKWVNDASDRVLTRNPPLIKSRDFMNRVFAEGLNIRIRISPKCKNLITDLEFMKEAPDGGKQVEKVNGEEKYGHCSDGARYLIISAFNSLFDPD